MSDSLRVALIDCSQIEKENVINVQDLQYIRFTINYTYMTYEVHFTVKTLVGAIY